MSRDAASWTQKRWAQTVAPVLMLGLFLAGWELLVKAREVPPYLLPPPSLIAESLTEHRQQLAAAWLVTAKTMAYALAAAVLSGGLAAVLFSVSRVLEISLFPAAVILQVTPLVAIAPLINIWLGDRVQTVLVVCATIVAFFPILSGTVVGLRSSDRTLDELMTVCGASRKQRLRYLLVPSALPYFLAGLKTAANLSLVGAVVAEFVVGASVDRSGLASIILESGFRLETPKLFAALALVSLTGILVYFAVHLLSVLLLGGWHESAGPRRD
ncbi:MAG: ABC transporter permease subunit [Planctomycetota bacterium]